MSDVSFSYKSLSEEEKKSRNILGRLSGVLADFKHPTRNGRLYSEALWDKTLNSDLFKEQIKNRCVLGELGHPENRDEIDIEKVAICLSETPTKMSDGTIQGIFDILDTPNGRILKTLCDYGCNIGISSRGNGDVETNVMGEEVVDPDTYDLKCWDAVLLPAVKAARMRVVESLENKKSLKQALTEALNDADEDARKVMTDTLNNLKIDIEESEAEETVDDVKVEMVKELQESIKAKQSLETENRHLQEKLSVCYAKETSLEEELQRFKSTVVSLSDSAKKVKPLQTKVEALTEALNAKDEVINKMNVRIQKLTESLKASESQQTRLTENLSAKSKEADKRLNESLDKNKTLTEQVMKFEEEKAQLKESLENLRKDASLKANEYKASLEKTSRLVEHYKQVANNVSDYYIKSRAAALGISAQEIKNRLAESYTYEDINKVCDDIRDYQLNVSKLPFDLKRSKVKVTESKETLAPLKQNLDDEVDEQLLGLANSMIKK